MAGFTGPNQLWLPVFRGLVIAIVVLAVMLFTVEPANPSAENTWSGADVVELQAEDGRTYEFAGSAELLDVIKEFAKDYGLELRTHPNRVMR